MRIAAMVELNAGERERLVAIAQGRTTSVRLAQRAAIVVLASDGVDNITIGEMLGVDRVVVGRWRSRYVEAGFAAIERDLPRGGRPPQVDQAEIVRLTTQDQPKAATQWSVRSMAGAAKVSKSSVFRVWRKHGLSWSVDHKPHRIKPFKVSRDPAFSEKLEAIVGLYMSPPEHALVLCLDEKTQVQALDRTQPGLPMKPGRAATMTHDYKRHGTTTLFAAMNTLDGSVIGQ